jgi:hypothetical protein
VPFYFGKTGDAVTDYETQLVHILTDVAIDAVNRTVEERVAAAESLMTYQGRHSAKQALQNVQQALEEEVATATDNESREAAERVLAIVNG